MATTARQTQTTSPAQIREAIQETNTIQEDRQHERLIDMLEADYCERQPARRRRPRDAYEFMMGNL